MKFEVDKSKCVGCGACLKICPSGAIKIDKDGKAFIIQDKCRGCGICQNVCSFSAIGEISENSESVKNSLDFSVSRKQSFGFGVGKDIVRRFGRRLGNGHHRRQRRGGHGKRMG